MPIMENLVKEVKKVFGFHEADTASAGTGDVRPVNKKLKLYDETSLTNDRKTKTKKCVEMFNTDLRIAKLILKIASDACIGGFKVNVESGITKGVMKKAQKIINSTQEQTEMNRKSKGWIVNLLNTGTLFLEIITDESGANIIRLKQLASIITNNRIDSEGNFPKDKKPYYQVDPMNDKTVLKEFDLWQIIQINFEEQESNQYGEPLFASGRKKWDMLIKCEENIVVRRLLRATKRLLHSVGTADKPGNPRLIEEYMRQNRDALDNPMEVYHDFFGNGATDIKEISGDTNIGEMEDVNYLEAMFPIRAGIPKALYGREKDVNRDVLDEQEEDYIRVLGDINDLIEYGLRKVFNLALLINGITPDSVKYVFKWGSKDRSDLLEKLQIALVMKKIGYSFETIFRFISVGEHEFDEEIERIKKQKEEGVVPYEQEKETSHEGETLANTKNPERDRERGNKDNSMDKQLKNNLVKIKSMVKEA